MKYLYLLLFSLSLGFVSAQETAEEAPSNIIPNPSFEEYVSYPVGWFYTGKHFSEVMKYWSSPSAASPDVFGPEITVPMLWRDKGFGKATVQDGTSMAGITVVGCGDGKPHCREYLQTPLLEALVKGQKYEISFWVKRHEGGYHLEQLGVLFKSTRTYLDDDNRLEEEGVHKVKVPFEEQSKWMKVTTTFVAEAEHDYMIIGNFERDLDSRVSAPEEKFLSFGYFYVDGVSVEKKAPILNAPEPKATWEGKELKPPATFVLTNIFFDTDEATLLPRSFRELNKLADLMKEHEGMVIRINGHTDSDGGEDYNDELAVRRAAAVEAYLKTQEVPQRRLSVVGYGLHRPIATNDTEEGRQLNRRVEFTIMEM